jgi:hypothetical protein
MAFDNIETVKRAVEIDSGRDCARKTDGQKSPETLAVELENGAYRPLAVIYKRQGAVAGHQAIHSAAERAGLSRALPGACTPAQSLSACVAAREPMPS